MYFYKGSPVHLSTLVGIMSGFPFVVYEVVVTRQNEGCGVHYNEGVWF